MCAPLASPPAAIAQSIAQALDAQRAAKPTETEAAIPKAPTDTPEQRFRAVMEEVEMAKPAEAGSNAGPTHGRPA